MQLGVILGGAPRGDLDLAPRPVDVEHDKEIDGTVATILAVVAFELARLGRDRLAHLADELGPGLSSKQTTGRSGSGASA